ncbi:MAG: replicative DNA helicase [Desulfobaccales bacterium]|nr:replicative DNA helicase [Desulfobaccales bacterium]
MSLGSIEAKQESYQLMEIRKLKSDFASINNYQEFRAEMFSMAIQPWVKNAVKCKNTAENIPEGIWAMIGCDKTDNGVSNLVLLAFAELYFEEDAETSVPFWGVSSFDKWVTQFNPRTMGDWLMVPKLFLMHLRTGRNLPALTATPDPWIDALLSESRGMLMWSHQFIEMIRMIGDVGITEATKIHSRYLMMQLKHREMLEKIYYEPSDQTLMQIFRERTVGMQHLGSPDYFFADWLSKRYQSSNQINIAYCDNVIKNKKELDHNKAELSNQGFFSIQELLPNVISVIDQACAHDNQHKITGVATGFDDLDSITAGLQQGDLIIVAGRPSMGKTIFALNIAENVSLNSQLPVAIFSMDASSNQLAMRLVASVGHLNKHRMLAGDIKDDDWEQIKFALGKLSETPIYIDDESSLNSNDICARSLKLKSQRGDLGLIIVDCLQLMSVNSRIQNENSIVRTDVALQSLKMLAKQLNCPIIILSQLNRNLEKRTDKRPVLKDLQSSNYADIVLFLYRDEVYDPESVDKGSAEIIIAKHRNGSLGCIRLNFDGQYGLFENYIMK